MIAKFIKILAIDDNRDNMMVLRAVVNERLPTAKVFTASNGRKGLDLAFAYDPDVILLDIVMPEMDGFEVCRRLKDDQFLHAIPVVFLTALRTDRESRIRALEIGAESFLSKPFDEVEIIAQILAMAKIKEANRRTLIEKDHLEALVKERTMELQKSHAQLLHSEKLSAVGSLSASIAHEFNNPLQCVTAILNGLSHAALAEEEQRLVALAVQECRRMKDLIASLRDFYRPTSGKLEPVDLHAVFDALLLITKKELLTRRISVVKKYADNFPSVIGVADQLKQVLINLLNNASYACESGGTITLATATTEDSVVVHIEDTGTGISQKNLGRIFEPFFTTKPETKGTGLGLSVSYGIIKTHGGRIEVKSEVGKGSVFSIFLPLTQTNDAVLPPEPKIDCPSPDGASLHTGDSRGVMTSFPQPQQQL